MPTLQLCSEGFFFIEQKRQNYGAKTSCLWDGCSRIKFDVYVTVHHWYNNINSQLDATIIILLIYGYIYIPIYPDEVPPHPGHQQAASSVLHNTGCKYSLVLLRMDEIIVQNMLSWFKFLIKLFLLLLVGCLYYCINDACSHKHQI